MLLRTSEWDSPNVSKISEIFFVGEESSIVKEFRQQKSLSHLTKPFFFQAGTSGEAQGELKGSITQSRTQSSTCFFKFSLKCGGGLGGALSL